MLPLAEESNVHSNLWWLFGEHNVKWLNFNTVKQEMGSCNSSYKIGCVEPEGFQQLIADRFFQKGNPYLTISSFKWFQQAHECSTNVIVLLHNKRKTDKEYKKNMANALIVSRPDSCFYKRTRDDFYMCMCVFMCMNGRLCFQLLTRCAVDLNEKFCSLFLVDVKPFTGVTT